MARQLGIAVPMTLAVVALFAHGPTTLTGIASWRVKETDRIAAMAAIAVLALALLPGQTASAAPAAACDHRGQE